MSRRPAELWIRLLLRCYPAQDRAANGAEMAAVYRELHERAVARLGRLLGGALAILETAFDTAIHAPAAHLARTRLGSRSAVAPHHRPSGTGGGSMTGILDEIRHALRSLLRRPGFALLSVLLLGAGIAINTTQFAVVRAVLLRPLPYPEPDRLVAIWSQWVDFEETWVSEGEYREYRDHVAAFDGVALFARQSVTLGGEPRREQSAQAAREFFRYHGFHEVVVGTRVEALLQILGLPERRTDNHRDFGGGRVLLDATA